VPNVVGQKLARAKSRIVRAHCRVGNITRKHSSLKKRGRVLSQAPRPGRTLKQGAKVNLKVGKGRS
jgi:beta-lactam-binding protein with PASTA domain